MQHGNIRKKNMWNKIFTFAQTAKAIGNHVPLSKIKTLPHKAPHHFRIDLI